MRRSRHAGFTLLEVMIALAILAGALVALIHISASSSRATMRAAKLTTAVGLARGKMYDLEEELLHAGFQDTEEEIDGDFSEEGFEDFTWEARIEKIELPSAGQVQQAMGALQGEGEDQEDGGLGMMDPSMMGGLGMIMTQFERISAVLENAVRKVVLTVRWKTGKKEEQMIVEAYFTDPKAVDQSTGGGGQVPELPRGPSGEPAAGGRAGGRL